MKSPTDDQLWTFFVNFFVKVATEDACIFAEHYHGLYFLCLGSSGSSQCVPERDSRGQASGHETPQ